MNALRRYRWALFLLVGPTFLLYSYFVVYPIFRTASYSLTRWNAISPPIFLGLQNYEQLRTSGDFWIVMQNTIVGLVLALIIQVGAGLVFAYLIYRTARGFRLFRALVFLPVVLAPAAVALMFTLVFNSDIGPINRFFEAIGLAALKRNWLSDKNVVFYAVLTPMIYQFVGLYVIVLLAGMQSIPEEVIESSFIDGSSSLRTFRSIIIPMQWDIIFICVILITAGSFKAFEHSYIMTWGGPGVRSAFLGVYMYFRAFVDANFGYGSAVAIVILVGTLLFTLVFRTVLRRFDYE